MTLKIRNKIINEIQNKNNYNFAIIGHNNPDADCVGAIQSLKLVLESLHKKVDIILQSKINKRYAPIVGNDMVDKIWTPYMGKQYDVVFMLDVSHFDRTYYNIKTIAKKIIIIDHHYDESHEKCDIYLNEHDASTGITLYKIIKYISPITYDIANAIYLTIRGDTGNFKNANTTSNVHKIVSELLLYGVDINLINNIFENKSISYIHLMGQTFKNVQYIAQYKITYLIVTEYDIKNANSTYEEASLLIEQIRSIGEITFLFLESQRDVKVKGRSKSVNINEIFSYFNGGGHKTASGCVINKYDAYEAMEEIISYTKSYLDKLNNKKQF